MVLEKVKLAKGFEMSGSREC